MFDLALLDDSLVIWGLGLLLTTVVTLPFVIHARRRELETIEAHEEASRYGLDQPASLHPVVDPAGCIGIGNCVKACPEEVLGIEIGQAVAVRPARCIGHGLCERVCPVDAIQLVFGTSARGVELPRVQENFETNVEGLYIVGELGGMGLVANAFEQGRQCIEGILKEPGSGPAGIADLIVVGCGPAGLSASLTALHAGLQLITLEKEDVGGTVRHYPRKKLVMTRPVKVPGYGRLPLREVRKEELMELWTEVIDKAGLEVTTGETVDRIERLGPYHFRVVSSGGIFEAARVVLAIGRRGVPRKLGVPGEAAPHVQYSLREPESFRDERILVVGGGDSAVEAAIALSEQPGNEVRVSYRRDAFSRIKPGNQDRINQAMANGSVDVLWESTPHAIESNTVLLEKAAGTLSVPADQVFIFAGGVLPTSFLRNCGIEIETKFGQP
jgi:thioredoxin reductase/NAD-dependent dihydropyrimidine dehydrogenase PreA subunit